MPDASADDFDGFQTQFAQIMETILQTAVREATKLYEGTLQRLKAELVQLRQEKVNTKTGVTSIQSTERFSEAGSQKPGNVFKHRDIGVQCVEEVKHKWKSLRDTYTRKKREDDCRSGQAAKNKKTWKFMKVMEFLATSTEFRSVHSNISPENMNEGVEQVVVQKEVSDREEASASTSPGSSFSSPTVTRSTFNKRKRPETPDLLDRYLLSKEARESEKEERRREKEERREQRREQQNDENYLFALGLIPALRRLSPAVQSSVKLKIHQLLHDAEFGQASSAFFPQQSPVSYHQVPPQTPTNYGCSTTSWLP